MEVSYIPDNCWCGSSEFSIYFKGNWNNEVNAFLGKCNACGTIRTIEADSVSVLDYTEKGTYVEGLSLRHINSLITINQFIKKDSLIDIGCSQGSVIDEIRKKHPDITVYGIDLNKNAINNPVSSNIRIEYKKLSEVNEKFDNILALHVLEHIPDFGEYFQQIKRISNPGAILYFALPNINSYNATHSLQSWGALNPTQHSWHFSKKSFSKLISHFLPGSKVLVLKSSWIWPFSWKRFYRNLLFEGDQIEIVVRIKN
jgi:2-polyprenyl-3-methyl-5-hydroxy-6-metoxy-1,4-benzoquinol methylase